MSFDGNLTAMPVNSGGRLLVDRRLLPVFVGLVVSQGKTIFLFLSTRVLGDSGLHMRRATPSFKRGVDGLVVAAFCIGCSASSCQLPTSTELHVSVSNYDQVPAVRLELTEGPVSITVNCGETREWRFTSPTLLGPWHVRAKTADGHALGTRELDKRSQVILVEGSGFRVYPTIPSGMHGGVCRH
jgi:hypothetical protein